MGKVAAAAAAAAADFPLIIHRPVEAELIRG